MKRRTVNLSDAEAELIDRYSVGDSPEARALASLAGEEALPYSDSAAARSLIKLGIKQVQEELLERGYREIAANYTDEDRAFDAAGVLMAAHLWDDE